MTRGVSAALAVLFALTGTAHTTPGAAHASPRPGATVFGDSITVAMSPVFYAHDIGVVAGVGRQFAVGLRYVQEQRRGGMLPSRVAVELGTNGPISRQAMAAMMRALRDRRRVVLVTNYGARPWIPGNDREIAGVAARHRRLVRLVDWRGMVDAAPALVGPDGIHPTAAGVVTLSTAVITALNER